MNEKVIEKTEKKVTAEPRHVLPLPESRWQLKEHRNPGHWVMVEAGVTIEDLLDGTAVWANLARHLRRQDTIEVHWDDSSQFAILYVLDCARNWASLDVVLHKKDLKRPEPANEEQYKIHFSGQVDKHRIVRLSDREVIKAGFATETDAQIWLAEYKRKLRS